MKLAWLVISPRRLMLGAALATLAAALGILVSCKQILGIEPAMLEPDAASDSALAGTNGGGDDGADPLTCENYCALMDQNCRGEYREYLPGVCKPLCEKYLQYQGGGHYDYPGGAPPVEDTLGCRLWHVHAAQEDPSTHCRHAGPLGTVACGGQCDPFCRIVYSYCFDDNNISPPPYDGVAACESICNDGPFSYETDAGDLADDTDAEIRSGNTLNCRLWHLETAIQTSSPDPHCHHTAEMSMTCN